MIRLLVADDDGIVRKGLSQGIDWAANGIELVGVASDGEEAVSLAEKLQAQVVVLDIRMPFLDGVGAARRLRGLFPNLKIIFLTGHEDFHYAVEGIALKVSAFLLKPIENSRVLAAVRQCADELSNNAVVDSWQREGRQVLERLFWQNLVQTGLTDAAVEQAATLGVTVPPPPVQALVFWSFQPGLNVEGWPAAVVDQVRSRIGSLGPAQVFEDVDNRLVVLVSGGVVAESRWFEVLGPILDGWRERWARPLSLGMGTLQQTRDGYQNSYREALAALEQRHFIEATTIHFYRPLQAHRTAGWQIDFGAELAELCQRVCYGRRDEARVILARIESQAQLQATLTWNAVLDKAFEIVVYLQKALSDWSQENQMRSALLRTLAEARDQLAKQLSLKALFVTLGTMVESLCQIVMAGQTDQQQRYVSAALDFMERQYQDRRLSLTHVAQVVNISPAYLSALFKKEGERNFSDCLMDIRMRHAKQLIQSRDIKTFEVSAAVGFRSPQYFNACFKKLTGLTPSEYKRSVT